MSFPVLLMWGVAMWYPLTSVIEQPWYTVYLSRSFQSHCTIWPLLFFPVPRDQARTVSSAYIVAYTRHMELGGKWEGVSRRMVCVCVCVCVCMHLQLIHVIQQKPTQNCKAFILQLKIKREREKEDTWSKATEHRQLQWHVAWTRTMLCKL